MNTKTDELKDACYELAEGAAWFTVKDFSIRVQSTDEGVIVDVYPKGRECDYLIASTYAFDSEAETSEGEEA